MRTRAIIAAVTVAGAASAAPNVLHAKYLPNYVSPTEDIEGMRPAFSRFYGACVMAVADKLCVDLYWMKERPGGHQGFAVRNNTDHALRVELAGCEIHNGSQTMAIDDAPFRADIPAHFYDTATLTNIDNKAYEDLRGVLPFRKDAHDMPERDNNADCFAMG